MINFPKKNIKLSTDPPGILKHGLTKVELNHLNTI